MITNINNTKHKAPRTTLFEIPALLSAFNPPSAVVVNPFGASGFGSSV